MRPVHFGEAYVKQSIHGLSEDTIQVEFNWPSWFLPSNPGSPAPQKLTSHRFSNATLFLRKGQPTPLRSSKETLGLCISFVTCCMVAQPCLQNVRPIPEVLSCSMVSMQCAECPRLLRGAAQKTLGLNTTLCFTPTRWDKPLISALKSIFWTCFPEDPSTIWNSQVIQSSIQFHEKKMCQSWQNGSSGHLSSQGHLCLARLSGFSPQGFRAHDTH